MTFKTGVLWAMLVLLTSACSPTVRVETPKEPIVINVNVKIEHDVRIRLEKDVESLIAKDSNLF